MQNYKTKSIKDCISKLNTIDLSKYKVIHRVYGDSPLPIYNKPVKNVNIINTIQKLIDKNGFKEFNIVNYAEGHGMSIIFNTGNFLHFNTK